MTLQRLLAGIERRLPARPLRPFFPFPLWRALFRMWTNTIRSQPDKRRAMGQLLEIHRDAYDAVDRGAVDYGDGVHAKHRLIRYHDFFVDRVRPGEHVLDLGCGKGELAYDLAERARATVMAIDANPSMIESARKRFPHPRVTYVAADAVAYVPPERIDVAVLSSVLGYVKPRTELLCGLRLRAGATRLLIREPVLDRDWTVPLRKEVGVPYFSDPEHEVEYDVDVLRRELAEAGWRMHEPIIRWGEIWVEASAE